MIKLANKIALASLLVPKEGMEKKALNLASLLRMSRNAANKGKLRRFSELLDKRNLAIDNVAHVRANAAKQQRALADIEDALLDSTRGPEMKAYRRLVDRSVAANGYPGDINRVIKLRAKESPDVHDQFVVERDFHNGTAGPWTLKDLAEYSLRQHTGNKIDRLTFTSL